MRLQNKIIFGCIVIFFLAIACLHILINASGKFLLAAKLTDVLKREVKIDSLRTNLFLGLTIKGIEADGLFRINEVYAAGGALDLVRENISLPYLRVKDLIINLERVPDAATPSPSVSDEKESPPVEGQALSALREAGTGRDIPSSGLNIKHLEIYNASINFIDKSMPGKEVGLIIKNIFFECENLNFGNALTFFKLKGRVPWQWVQQEGRIEADGWFNLAKKDMEATFKVIGIDGISLYPYYSKWVDLEKARIEKATLNFTSRIRSLSNELSADCQLELMDVVRRPLGEGEFVEKASRITDGVLNMFKMSDDGRVVLRFTHQTKMNKPIFGFESIRGAFEGRLTEIRSTNGFKAEDVIKFPVKLIEGTVKGASDVSMGLINSTFAVGKEIKRAVSDAFRKEE